MPSCRNLTGTIVMLNVSFNFHDKLFELQSEYFEFILLDRECHEFEYRLFMLMATFQFRQKPCRFIRPIPIMSR